MSKRQETVREVCFEVETLTDITLKEGGVFLPREVSAHFERFLSAYEREMEAKDAEIARLKAALKPVLDYGFGDYKTPWKPLMVEGELMKGCVRCGDGFPLSIVDEFIFGIDALIEMANAIGEAQRIMKEFTNGESHD